MGEGGGGWARPPTRPLSQPNLATPLSDPSTPPWGGPTTKHGSACHVSHRIRSAARVASARSQGVRSLGRRILAAWSSISREPTSLVPREANPTVWKRHLISKEHVLGGYTAWARIFGALQNFICNLPRSLGRKEPPLPPPPMYDECEWHLSCWLMRRTATMCAWW